MIEALMSIKPLDLKAVSLHRQEQAGQPASIEEISEATEELLTYVKACGLLARRASQIEPDTTGEAETWAL